MLYSVTQKSRETDLLSGQVWEDRLERHTGDLPNIPQAASGEAGISSSIFHFSPPKLQPFPA